MRSSTSESPTSPASAEPAEPLAGPAGELAGALATYDGRAAERWRSVVAFHLDGELWIHLRVGDGRVTLHGGRPPTPATVVEAPSDALWDWVSGRRDITHRIADGSARVSAGDYYDLVLLSRVFGRLQRERRP
jgi:hypothetical protein